MRCSARFNFRAIIFNINSIDIFYKCEDSDLEIYADETILYACASDINTVNSLHDLTTIT